MTGVQAMDEVRGEGSPLAHSLNGTLLSLVHKDDPLQQCLYMTLALHQHSSCNQTYTCTDSTFAFET